MDSALSETIRVPEEDGAGSEAAPALSTLCMPARLRSFLAAAGLTLAVGSVPVSLPGCSDDEKPVAASQFPSQGGVVETPTTPTPLQKEGEKPPQSSSGCQDASSRWHGDIANALGGALILVGGVVFGLRKAIPGDHWLERGGATVISGLATGAGVLSGFGTDWTPILIAGTALNSAVTYWSFKN